ncbi:MAG: DUF1127 domain-containing protein [Pararhodobacter sp.]
MTANTSSSVCLAHPLQAPGHAAQRHRHWLTPARPVVWIWSSLWARLERARCLARQRRALLDLDETLLRDIGLSREDALREAGRPFWDAPRHWLG